MTVNTEYPEPDQKRACMRCIWWLARNSVVGQCRRMPPARPDGEAAGFWPMTGRADWCGEYRDRAEALPPNAQGNAPDTARTNGPEARGCRPPLAVGSNAALGGW